MANVGTAAAGKTLIGAGNGASPTFATIGTNSGLTNHGVLIAQGNSAFVATSPGTSGQIFISNGASSDPSFQSGGSSVGQTITGNTGGALSPVLGNWNILGSATPSGSTPVSSAGSGNTLVLNVQRSQAVASTDLTRVGLAAFDSTSFSVDANGFVSLIGGGFTWSDVSGAFSPLKENGYFITGTATATLPAAPAQGDTIKFFVDHATQDLTIDAPGTQIIRMGSTVSSAGGTALSTAQGDSVELTYRTSDTCWCAIGGFSGTWVLA